MAKKIKLVVFDLDGTLLNTKEDICDSMNTALKHFGLPEHPLEDYGNIVGGGTRTAAERACPDGTDEETLDGVFSLYKEIYIQNCLNKTTVYKGIHDLIGRLKVRGIILGILTNKTDTAANLLVNHFFPQRPFSAVLGNRGDIPIKPRPDMGLWLCRTLDIPADRCLFLGDSDTDMYFAKNVNFLPIGAAWGFRGRDELIYAGAKAVIEEPLELLELLR